MSEQLWFNDERTIFFLLPADAAVPKGSRWLRTFDGSVRGFDPEALSAYEVDEQTAQPHVNAWLEGGYRRAREAFARGYGDEPPMAASLKDVLGVDPARLGSEPEALAQVVEHAGQGLKRWLDHDAPPEVAQSVKSVAATLAQMLQKVADDAQRADTADDAPATPPSEPD